MSSERIPLFVSIGLSEAKAKETLKNEKLSKNLEVLIRSIPSSHGAVSPGVGTLIYHMASKMKPQVFDKHHPVVLDYVLKGKLSSELRLNAALEYILKKAASSEINIKEMEEVSGVGVVITPEQIENEVEKAIKFVKDELIEKRYRYNTGLLMSTVRSNLKWADGKALKNEVDIQILDILGPKTDADLAPLPKAPKAPKKESDDKKSSSKKPVKNVETEGAVTIKELMKTKVKFHKPGENYTSDGYVTTPNTEALLKEHLKRTGGRVQTRFPPEPNGILHIGHAKAININFGYADAHNGLCNLRYDDTNPEKEEEKFFVTIKEMVEWLGYRPDKITHSSDNFHQLYEWAKVLIKKDLAYICHQKVEDIRGFNPPPSPWRNRPVEESMQLFEDMKHGKFDEGEATLRLKVTLEEGKVDPVAYRIKYAAHHRTGDTWCIYPTYDYTHCLCDSIEDITHSLCTKEFQNRRSSYYWLCNALNIYCPVQWEYGRLNMSYGVISKRKIAKLIETGICSEWDDPRLFTLTALRRRGFPPEAINSFVAQLGVTGAIMTVDPSMLEASVRSYLNVHAPRCMVVLEPLKVKIINGSKLPKTVGDVPLFPDDPSKGTRSISLSFEIYIERSDFKDVSEKGYRRLCPGQSVGLRYAGIVLNYVRTIGKNEIEAEFVPVSEVATKPKAFIHWVNAGAASKITVCLYERLFKHANPEDPVVVPGGYLSDINPDSLHILEDSVIDSSVLKGLKTYDKFQFERNGFFSVDPDSKPSHFVFNRTVSLKEDAGK